MCFVSVVMQGQIDQWQQQLPKNPWNQEPRLGPQPNTPEELERQLQAFKDLIERARQRDLLENQPDCEMEDKKRILQELADKLGIGKLTFLEKDPHV